MRCTPHFRERHALTAINLPLHEVWRFDGGPQVYYLDWVKAAAEEAHISLLRAHLQSLGHGYGDFPAGTGLWDRPPIPLLYVVYTFGRHTV